MPIFKREKDQVIYTADDEMPDCIQCDNCDQSATFCCNSCGAEHGWFSYRRTAILSDIFKERGTGNNNEQER